MFTTNSFVLRLLAELPKLNYKSYNPQKRPVLSLCAQFSFIISSQHELPQPCLTELVNSCWLRITKLYRNLTDEVPNHQILCHLSSYLHTVVLFGTSLTAAISLAHNALPGTATL